MERQLCSKVTPQKAVDLRLLDTLCIAETGQNTAETVRIFC